MLLESRINECDVRRHRENQRDSDDGRTGDIEPRHDTRDVEEQHEEEDGGEDRQEAAAVLFAQKVLGDVDADEVESHFDERLEAPGNDLHVSRSEPEQDDEQGDHDHADDHDAVHREGSAFEEDDVGEELGNRGSVELNAFSKNEAGQSVQQRGLLDSGASSHLDGHHFLRPYHVDDRHTSP